VNKKGRRPVRDPFGVYTLVEKFGQRDEVLQQLTSPGASHPEKFG